MCLKNIQKIYLKNIAKNIGKKSRKKFANYTDSH